MAKNTFPIGVNLFAVGNFFSVMNRGKRAVAGFTNSVRQSGSKLRNVNNQLDMMNRHILSLRGAAGVFTALGAGLAVREFIQTNAQFENLQARLEVVIGSAEKAAMMFRDIQKFASETPFTVEQTTQAMIKLASRGLEPNIEALREYGDIASVLGTRLTGMQGGILQVVEAVSDLVVGQTRRFEELGVSVQSMGNEIEFIFNGVRTLVPKTAKDIEDFVRKTIGGRFTGAMQKQMETLAGMFSIVLDNMRFFFYEVGRAGTSNQLKALLQSLIDLFQKGIDNAEKFSSVLVAGLKPVNAGFRLLVDNAGLVTSLLGGLATGGGLLVLAKVVRDLNITFQVLAAAQVGSGLLSLFTTDRGKLFRSLSRLTRVSKFLPMVMGKVIGVLGTFIGFLGKLHPVILATTAGLSALTAGFLYHRDAIDSMFNPSKKVIEEMEKSKDAVEKQSFELRRVFSKISAIASQSVFDRTPFQLLELKHALEDIKRLAPSLEDVTVNLKEFTVQSEEYGKIQEAVNKETQKFQDTINDINDKIEEENLEILNKQIEKLSSNLERLKIVGNDPAAFLPGFGLGTGASSIKGTIQSTTDALRQFERQVVAVTSNEEFATDAEISDMALSFQTLQDKVYSGSKAFREYETALRNVNSMLAKVNQLAASGKVGGITDVDVLVKELEKLKAIVMRDDPIQQIFDKYTNLRDEISKELTLTPLQEWEDVMLDLREQITLAGEDWDKFKNNLQNSKAIFYAKKAFMEYKEAQGAVEFDELIDGVKESIQALKLQEGQISKVVVEKQKLEKELETIQKRYGDASIKAAEFAMIMQQYLNLLTEVESKQKESNNTVRDRIKEMQYELSIRQQLMFAEEEEIQIMLEAERIRNSGEKGAKALADQYAYLQEQLNNIAKQKSLIDFLDDQNKEIQRQYELLEAKDSVDEKYIRFLHEISDAEEAAGSQAGLFADKIEELKNKMLAFFVIEDATEKMEEYTKAAESALNTMKMQATQTGELSRTTQRWIEMKQELIDLAPDTKEGQEKLNQDLAEFNQMIEKIQRNRMNDFMREMTIEYERQSASLGKTSRELDLQNRLFEIRQEAIELGITDLDQYMDKAKRLHEQNVKAQKEWDTVFNGMKLGLRSWAEENELIAQRVADVMAETADRMSDNITSFISGTKQDWRGMVKFMVDELLKLQVKKNIVAPLLGALGNLIPGLIPTGTSSSTATGNINTPVDLGSVDFGPGDFQFLNNPLGNLKSKYGPTGKYMGAIGGNSLQPFAMGGQVVKVEINQPVTIDARNATPETVPRIREAMLETKEMTKQEILRDFDRGGSFAKKSGRTASTSRRRM